MEIKIFLIGFALIGATLAATCNYNT